ncbi:mRNA interferase RelE/StbE [Lipingzhangella halophila]|uniref:mRNA interferase RelE/StbE n=1 Tax=Lipingzhangella halophila TaxID=1783352 RepID=A0A7W7RGY3_9ACTN|nr:type II toxin-antitoxin system RelE/ParE family toxin [Lipingzhangella halophila]MBB4931759.1 mRNA interferase RelE/StbE [Lipingzhangella halophila]
MSGYQTRFHRAARDELRKIPKQTAMTILRKLANLENDPYGYGTTALVSRPERRRLRVGDYRVIYTVDNGQLVVWVIQVGHRSTIYD